MNILKFSEDINDARRYQEEDRLLSDYDTLVSYVDQGYFIHFTNKPELSTGVNIKTEHKTPAGIYCYPLTSDILSQKVPYRGSSKYITIFKSNSDNYIKASSYTDSDFESDYKKLETYYDESNSRYKTYDVMVRESVIHSKIKHPLSSLLYLIYNLSGGFNDPNIFKVTNLFKKLGYIGIYDDGFGIIHVSEPDQAVFFSSSSLDVIDIIRNPLFKDFLEPDRDSFINQLEIKNKIINNYNKKIFSEKEYYDFIESGESLEFVPEEFRTPKICKLYIEKGGDILNVPDDVIKLDPEFYIPKFREYIEVTGLIYYIPEEIIKLDRDFYIQKAKEYINEGGELYDIPEELRTPELIELHNRLNKKAYNYINIFKLSSMFLKRLSI